MRLVYIYNNNKEWHTSLPATYSLNQASDYMRYSRLYMMFLVQVGRDPSAVVTDTHHFGPLYRLEAYALIWLCTNNVH